MAKNITRRDFLKTAALGVAGMTAAGLLGGCSTTGNSAKTGTYTPGTYSATATGMATIKVTATFDAEKITDIVLDLSGETPSIGQAAAEELVKRALEAQSPEFDAVTGATVTSNAVAKALKNCIAQAKGEIDVTVVDETTQTKEVVDWLGTEPDTPEVSETVETGTVIVGAGNGGLMCGAVAAKLGLKFAIIETLPTNGDTRHWYGAIGSKHAQAAGVQMDINRLKREVSRYASGKNSKEVLNTWINESAEMSDFIDELYAQYNPESKCTFTAGEEAYWPEDCRDGYACRTFDCHCAVCPGQPVFPAGGWNLYDGRPDHWGRGKVSSDYPFYLPVLCGDPAPSGGIKKRRDRQDRVPALHPYIFYKLRH